MNKRKLVTSHEIRYLEEERKVLFHLRRPVYFHVPTEVTKNGRYNPMVETTPPKEELVLEHVHGYRGKDARNNFLPLASGEIVYFIAGVVIVLDPVTGKQRIYDKHSDHIKSLAVHPDGVTVVTGQAKGLDDEEDEANIRIWNSKTMETLHVFGEGKVMVAVACLTFGNWYGKEVLAAVDQDRVQNLTLWDWEKETVITECKCSNQLVIDITFSMEETPRIISTGKDHIDFWYWEHNSQRLKKQGGLFQKHPKPNYITAVRFNNEGSTISGDSSGNVIYWKKGSTEIERFIPSAHDGSIFSITACNNGCFITSCKNRQLKLWESDFSSEKEAIELPDYIGAARAVIEVGDFLLIATTKNLVAKGNFKTDFEIVSKGANGELWALASHPSADRYITSGYDGEAVERRISTKKIIWSASSPSGIQSVCYSPGGEVIIFGFVDGKMSVLDAETKEIYLEQTVGEGPVYTCKFSPNGSFLAVGSRDHKVYVFDVSEDFRRYTARGECKGHTSAIRCLDFSADESMMRTNSNDYELLFWRVEDCVQEAHSDNTRDVQWATRNCHLCFENFGVWPMGVDGTDINAVSVSHKKHLAVTADDFGKVKLFKGRTHFAYTSNKKYVGHSSHVTNVVFSHDDDYVISTGGNDKSVMEWKVEKCNDEV